VENAILPPENDVAGNGVAQNDVVQRIASRSVAKRESDYAAEVRRLLDAALEVMRRRGTASRPRVADIVAAAGLSNDAFYRHFPSKDALVAAVLEDGAQRLARYLEHQMGKADTPEGKVRRWVEGVLSQTREEIAATTLAVLWNGERSRAGRYDASETLSVLLHAPLAELGSDDPEMDASLAAHAVVGKISEYLSRRAAPTDAETDRITAFCLRAASRP
jgi:AcrR family transcriptional regulator